MSKKPEDEVGLSAKLWKPSDVLEAVENQTVKTAKFLHACKARLERRPERASVDDAIALAELIIALSRHGRNNPLRKHFRSRPRSRSSWINWPRK